MEKQKLRELEKRLILGKRGIRGEFVALHKEGAAREGFGI